MMDRFDEYDPMADLYNRRWGGFARSIVPALDRLVFDRLDPGDRVLDLCCGTGQLLAELDGRGLDLVGVDGSGEMIERARDNVVAAELMVADARTFTVDRPVDAVVSTFDSLNHLMSAQDLAMVFARVSDALAPGGVFVFDLNNEDGYGARWQGSFCDVTDDEVIAARSGYDAEAGTAWIAITHLVPVAETEPDNWRRADMRFTQRCHPDDEVRAGLDAAGLVDIERWDANDVDPVLTEVGRSVYRATKPV